MPIYKDVSSLEVVRYTVPKDGTFADGVDFILEKLDAIPKEDVKPVRHSKFQGDHTPVIYDTRVCFSCKQRVPVDNFCIRCGAKMD